MSSINLSRSQFIGAHKLRMSSGDLFKVLAENSTSSPTNDPTTTQEQQKETQIVNEVDNSLKTEEKTIEKIEKIEEKGENMSIGSLPSQLHTELLQNNNGSDEISSKVSSGNGNNEKPTQNEGGVGETTTTNKSENGVEQQQLLLKEDEHIKRCSSADFPQENRYSGEFLSSSPETRPHSHSVGSTMFVKISFPWNDGSGGVYKVKKFTFRTTVSEAIRELNAHLSEPFKSDKNKLYFNDMPLENDRLLSSYRFTSSDKLLFQRDPLYEFSLKDDPTKDPLILDPSVKVFEVIKKLVVWMYGSIPASDHNAAYPSYKLFKKLEAMNRKGCGLRLMEQKNLADYAIRKTDMLELVARLSEAKSTEDIIEINVLDAPVTAQDKPVEQEEEKKVEKPSSPKLEGKRKSRSFPALVREDSGVGTPYNVVHKSHVNFDYQWTGKDIVEAFEFKEKLGQGGYGAVFKAQHKETGFTMAVKVLALSGPGRADLQKEIDVLKKCRCPNVLSYYGTILHDNEIWILMDHCGVGSVKDLMKACVETLDEEQISMVTAQVLKGLAYLHAKGIVHMDVKAANILLTEEGSVKLGNFEIDIRVS